MKARRLFVALAVGPKLADALEPIIKKLRIGADRRGHDATWAKRDNLHLTLCFLGSTPDARLALAIEAVRDAASRLAPFSVGVRGVGAFPGDRSARVLWAGVSRSQAVLDAQTASEEALYKRGFSLKEEAEWKPHITLGRLRSLVAVGDLISPFARKTIGELEGSELVLFESVLRGKFMAYEPLERAAFGARAPR